MTDDERAMLRTICIFPDDDTPRLVYADYLEERGEPERAEFIRVQCAIASLPMAMPVACPNPKCDGRGCVLRRREGELWPFVMSDICSLPTYSGGPSVTTTDWIIDACPSPGNAVVGIVRRGFIDEVHLPLAAFVGTRCENCEGEGTIESQRWENAREPCPDCGGEWEPRDEPDDPGYSPGTGRVGGLAGRLFAAHPITKVVLTQAVIEVYADGERSWAVFRQQLGPLWDIMFPDSSPLDTFAETPDRAKVEGEVSAACVAYGRSLVDWIAEYDREKGLVKAWPTRTPMC